MLNNLVVGALCTSTRNVRSTRLLLHRNSILGIMSICLSDQLVRVPHRQPLTEGIGNISYGSSFIEELPTKPDCRLMRMMVRTKQILKTHRLSTCMSPSNEYPLLGRHPKITVSRISRTWDRVLTMTTLERLAPSSNKKTASLSPPSS